MTLLQIYLRQKQICQWNHIATIRRDVMVLVVQHSFLVSITICLWQIAFSDGPFLNNLITVNPNL